MYDSVDVGQLPPNGDAYAGYVDGKWATFPHIVARFPHAKHVSIATSSRSDALILDVERGDASPIEVPAWITRQHKRGIYAPGFYASVSVTPEVIYHLTAAGIARNKYRVWTAHWNGVPHRCTPGCYASLNTEAGATQYQSSPDGHNYDVSICRREFLPG